MTPISIPKLSMLLKPPRSSTRLRELRLSNFKCYKEEQTIPLRPLTLIFGPNSAGKSSIIHALGLF